MNVIFRFFLTAAGAWGTSLLVSLVLMGVTAAVTQKWSASRLQPVMALLFGVMVLLFGASVFFVHSAAKRMLTEGSVVLYTVLYAAGALLTLMITGFITLVVFNR